MIKEIIAIDFRHRFVNGQFKVGWGVPRPTIDLLHYFFYYIAWRIIREIEVIRMIYKGQVERVNSKDVLREHL